MTPRVGERPWLTQGVGRVERYFAVEVSWRVRHVEKDFATNLSVPSDPPHPAWIPFWASEFVFEAAATVAW